MNLVISMLAGTVLAGLAESMALAEHLGLDHGDVLEIVSMSPVNCPLVRSKGNGEGEGRGGERGGERAGAGQGAGQVKGQRW